MNLKPGKILSLTFPDLPPTLEAQFTGSRRVPRLTAKLPECWNPDEAFPLCVHLSGWTGGHGDKGKLQAVLKKMGDRPYIAVTMPLFKKELDKSEVHDGIVLSAFDDYPVLSRCYKTMLTEFLGVLPHVDSERSAFGGFSNGAHATSVLLSGVDSFLLKNFQRFYLVEGGFDITSFHKMALKSKKIVYFIGGRRMTKMRRAFIQRAEANQVLARRQEIDYTVHLMPGVEHAFPEQYYSLFRDEMLF